MQMEFDKVGAQVVIVSFGNCEAAVKWRRETGFQYPILIDPKRQVKISRLLQPLLIDIYNNFAIMRCDE